MEINLDLHKLIFDIDLFIEINYDLIILSINKFVYKATILISMKITKKFPLLSAKTRTKT